MTRVLFDLFCSMLLALAVFLMVAGFSEAEAADRWDTADLALASGLAVGHAADYLQTIQIKGRPDLEESDWLGRRVMGRQPEAGVAAAYFVGVYAAELGVAHVLPSGWRKAWLAGRLGFSIYTVRNNCNLGLKVRF